MVNGKWGTTIPTSGWIMEYVEDLGEGSKFVCEMCETQEIRYGHHMSHDSHHLLCGVICAGRMTGDMDKAKRADLDARNKTKREETAKARLEADSARRRRLVWHETGKGNHVGRYGDFCMTLYRDAKSGMWKYVISSDKYGYKYFGKQTFQEIECAMMRGLEVLTKADKKYSSR